jgi:two-component system sensor histidine kinase YesM
MRFQTKLLLSYSLIIVLLAIVLGIAFYEYSSDVFERNARSSLVSVSGRMARELDNLARTMDFVTTYLLSDSDFYSSMVSLAYLDRNEPGDFFYINEGWRLVKRTLLSYSISRNFHAVNVFNRSGDFLSSNLVDFAATSDSRPRLADVPWLSRADAQGGRPVLIPPYDDPWRPSGSGGPRVYGLARAVQGAKGPMGYIEVQNALSDLDSLFSLPEGEGAKAIAFLSDGTLFYARTSMGSLALAHYASLAKAPCDASLARNPATGREEIVASASADFAGVRILLAQDRVLLLKSLAFTRNITIVVGLLIILVSLVYNYLFSRQLARPIRQLKAYMEGTEIGNLPDALDFEGPSHPLSGSAGDEIEALGRAFVDLRSRLGESISRELVSQSLQSRARFDSLQAQVSPHFLYNILTVIANKGLEAGSEEIGEICDGIADMLRYSTSTTARSATLAQEIEHVRSYLFLMKKRLEHRLEFSIEADPTLLGERTPKIVLQQLAENSISHGFDGSKKTLSVSLSLFARNGRWRVEVGDDGVGFDAEVLSSLRRKTDTIAAERPGSESPGSAIGGMGLVNLYSRLRLFYEGDFNFELGVSPLGGALVAIGAPLGSGRAD